MSKYTIELRYLLDIEYHFKWYTSYNVYDENMRDVINKYITDHYMFREIGFETPNLFDHYMSITMNEIMPYYNELFKSTLFDINPLINYQFKEDMNRNEEGRSEGSSKGQGTTTSGSNLKNVESRPADGIVHMSDIEENIYANTAVLENSNGTGTTDSSANTNTLNNVAMNYTKNVQGLTGVSQSKLVMEFRKAIVNVLREIVNNDELKQCFMGVY